jgi:hypothetical protein
MAHKVAIINGKQPSAGLGGVSDADHSNVAVNFLTAGVAKATNYLVEQQASPNMTVKVNPGIAYVKKSDNSNVYVTNLDAVQNVNISSNSSGNPRIDAVVIKVDLGATPNNYADNVATLVVVQGTAAASPVAPSDSTIQSSVGSGNAFLRLADVTVGNGVSSILTANISDKRTGVQLNLLGGYVRFNTSTNKLQFSHDGTTYKDMGSGGATPTFTITGTVAVGTNVCPAIIVPFPLTITKAFAYAKTGPTGADLIFDINKNGTTIWSTQSNRLKIAAAATSGNQTTFNTTSLAEGDILTVDVDQVGSTIAGADVTVQIFCQG